MLSLEDIKLSLVDKLSNYRYDHSMRVALEAKKLAKHYGIDEENAYLAGLLHDVAKEFSLEESREWILKYGLSESLLKNVKTCHAGVGALVAKDLYGVNDIVCRAIQYHTVGNVEMNVLDKIVFIADKIESGKDYPGIEEERLLAYEDIDKALILCLINNKRKLEKEGKKFNVDSEKLLSYLLDK